MPLTIGVEKDGWVPVETDSGRLVAKFRTRTLASLFIQGLGQVNGGHVEAALLQV